MAAPRPTGSEDLFDTYFRRADLDGDGHISGSEAVAFFQGSNLPKHVLAKVWSYADAKDTGYLGRAEFYNALKLVTVAQSKRELTPEIVKAAINSPASAKIPAPNINLAAASYTTGSTVRVGISSSSQFTQPQSQAPWPNMTRADVQKNKKLFVQVDTDRDGKITGHEARNLFLSWSLPREVLKQIWDLSDQDNDSMLSLREFCIAVYLTDRYREGLPLPPVFPITIISSDWDKLEEEENFITKRKY